PSLLLNAFNMRRAAFNYGSHPTQRGRMSSRLQQVNTITLSAVERPADQEAVANIAYNRGGHGPGSRHARRLVPDPLAARGWRYGRGVPRSRHEAESRRGTEGSAGRRCGSSSSPRSHPARGASARRAQPSEHRTDSRRRGITIAGPGHGARRRTDAGGDDRTRARPRDPTRGHARDRPSDRRSPGIRPRLREPAP